MILKDLGIIKVLLQLKIPEEAKLLRNNETKKKNVTRFRSTIQTSTAVGVF